MRLKTNNHMTIGYPFNEILDVQYRCRCGKLLRKCAAHNRIYEVSESDPNEIISARRHKCAKKKQNGRSVR